MSTPAVMMRNQAVALLERCIAEGFTGTLQFEFKKGAPQVSKRTETCRLGLPDQEAGVAVPRSLTLNR